MNNDSIEQGLFSLLQYFNMYVLLQLLIGGLLIWATNSVINRSSKQLMTKLPTRRFLILQASTLIGFSIYIFGTIVLIVGVVQPPREFIIAATGSIAVAMGFALKDIAASLVGGLLLLFDRPFQVGDRITYGNEYGEVLSIGLRTVRLKTLAQDIVTIPNSRFITDVVTSGNAGEANMTVSTLFYVSLNADLDKARAIIEEVIVTSRYVYLKAPRSFSFLEEEIGGVLAIKICCRADVLDTSYEKAFQSDIVLRVTTLFREQGIERPHAIYKQIS